MLEQDIKENLLEISFLSRTVGAQQNGPRKIEAFQIYSEGIRDVNILEQYPMHIFAKGYEIVVPEPAVFIIQKLLAYPKRKPDYEKVISDLVKHGKEEIVDPIMKSMNEHFIKLRDADREEVRAFYPDKTAEEMFLK